MAFLANRVRKSTKLSHYEFRGRNEMFLQVLVVFGFNPDKQ